MAAKESLTEIQKWRQKKSSYQLKFPELFRSDASIYPSYTNLKLPYQVICRERKDAYRAMQAMRLQVEVRELSLRQVHAWDGVRIARIFATGCSPGPRTVLRKVPDPLTSKERQRLYNILGK